MHDYSHDSYVEVILRSADLTCRRKVRAGVDLHDSYTRLPAKLLEEMGWSIRGWISKSHEPPARLPYSSPESMALGAVTIEINDVIMRVLASFEDDHCHPVLGAHLMHCLGVKVAPEHRTMFADEILYPRPRRVIFDDLG